MSASIVDDDDYVNDDKDDDDDDNDELFIYILLYDPGHIKLTDFGLCRELKTPDSTTGSLCGTPGYM